VGLSFDTADLRSAAGMDGLSGEAAALWATATQTNFPGAVLPVVTNGTMAIYAVAESGLEWRKLQPLLLSFSGPTLTDFAGVPPQLEPTEPFDALLSRFRLHTTAKLRPGRFKGGNAAVIQGLRRLQVRLLAAPDLAVPRPEPTSRLLSRLQDSLNAGDADGAWRTLGTLGDELRLDATNLAGLEVEILASTGRWNAIRWHPRFEALAYSVPNSFIAELLLEAIYRTITEVDGPGAIPTLDASTAPMVDVLLRRVAISTRDAVLQLRALTAPVAPPTPPATSRPPEPPLPRTAEDESVDPSGRAEHALLAVAASPSTGDPDLDVTALTAMAALTPAARDGLLQRRIFAAIWAEMQERLGLQPPPRDWIGWMARLNDSNFNAAAYAASGARHWVLDDIPFDPSEAAALAQALLGVTNGLAAERLADGLPFLLSWAKADARWPRPALAPVYLAMLTCMALGNRRGGSIMKSAGPLLEGTLLCGLSIAEYRDALDAAAEIARTGMDRSAAFEALEILEIARSIAPAEQAALDAFSLALVAGLAVQSNRLTVGQRQLLRGLAAEVGWKEPVDATDDKAEKSLAAALAGKSVAIYTLTEGAARNARDQLRKIAPEIRIEINHDQVGTRGLATLAERVDLFIIAALSATHAATDFIRARCSSERIAYAPGKGAASIVRKVEEWATGQL
jgi:hypothetical protein